MGVCAWNVGGWYQRGSSVAGSAGGNCVRLRRLITIGIASVWQTLTMGIQSHIAVTSNLYATLTLPQHMAQSLKLSAELATASLQLLTKVKEAVNIRSELDFIECKIWTQANITQITPPIYKFKSYFTQ